MERKKDYPVQNMADGGEAESVNRPDQSEEGSFDHFNIDVCEK